MVHTNQFAKPWFIGGVGTLWLTDFWDRHFRILTSPVKESCMWHAPFVGGTAKVRK